MPSPNSPSKRRHASFRLSGSGPSHYGLGVSGLAYWRLLGWKIALMSAHASVLFSLVVLPLVASLGWFSLILLVAIPLGWVGSFLTNGLLCLILLPCLALAQRMIAEPVARDTTGWVAGSAVGIVGSVFGLVQVTAGLSSAAVTAGALGLLLGQAFGGAGSIAAAQAGGYLGSLSGLRRRRRRKKRGGPVRFSVWRLLAITAILAAILTVVRLAGDLAVPLIFSLTLSSAVAWAIHRPVAWATNRWLDWRLRRRRAKRASRLASLAG